MKRTALIATCLFGALVASQGLASASGNTWSMNGASCVATNASIQSDLYIDTAGTVGWNGTDTGTVTVYCPVSFPDLISTDCSETLVFTYEDTDGSGSATYGKAQLIQLDGSTGSLTTIGSALETTSGTSSTSGQNITESLTTCLTASDYYYVRVDLIRSGSTFVNLIGVSLEGS
jgi:hypothetical protein